MQSSSVLLRIFTCREGTVLVGCHRVRKKDTRKREVLWLCGAWTWCLDKRQWADFVLVSLDTTKHCNAVPCEVAISRPKVMNSQLRGSTH
jgi:hypothetical protein